MKEIIWKISLIILGIVALALYASEPARMYSFRYGAFARCYQALGTTADCAQLFSD